MHCTGVVLAGGRATRFGGAPKGLSLVGGARILDRVVRALADSSDALLMVANDLAAATWRPGIPVVPDVRPGEGSLGGILSALTHAPAAVLVVAWDMPFVDAAVLRHLRSLGEAEGDIAWPASHSHVGVEPLCAWYAPACRAVIMDALDRGDRRIAALGTAPGDTLRVRTLSAADVRRFGDPERLFLNVNTPDDLARAERWAAAPHDDGER